MTQYYFTNHLIGEVGSIPTECQSYNSLWENEIAEGEKLNFDEIERLKLNFPKGSNFHWKNRFTESWLDRWILWKIKLDFLRVQFMTAFALVLAMNHMQSPHHDWEQVANKLLALVKSQIKIYQKQFKWVEQGYWIIVLGDTSLEKFQDLIDNWQLLKSKKLLEGQSNLDDILNLPITEHELAFEFTSPVRIESIIKYQCDRFGFSVDIDWNSDNTIKCIKVIRSGFVDRMKLKNELISELTKMGWKTH